MVKVVVGFPRTAWACVLVHLHCTAEAAQVTWPPLHLSLSLWSKNRSTAHSFPASAATECLLYLLFLSEKQSKRNAEGRHTKLTLVTLWLSDESTRHPRVGTRSSATWDHKEPRYGLQEALLCFMTFTLSSAGLRKRQRTGGVTRESHALGKDPHPRHKKTHLQFIQRVHRSTRGREIWQKYHHSTTLNK